MKSPQLGHSYPSPILSYLVGAACIVLIVAGLKLAAPIVNLALLSSLLAFSISPIQNWLLRKRFRKGWAVFVTVLLILIGGSGLISILAVSVAGLINKLPAYEANLTNLWGSINAFFLDRGINVSGLLSLQEFDPKQMVGFAGKLLGTLLQGLSNSFLVVIVMVFVLMELASLQFPMLKGKQAGTGIQNRVNQTVADIGKYISITGWNGLINAAANFIWLLILGIDFALTWAVLSFFFNFIPNIGIVMAVIPPAFIALLEHGWVRALLVIVGYAVLNFLAENVLKPRTMKARLHISPLLTILSVIFWSWVLGVRHGFHPGNHPAETGQRTDEPKRLSRIRCKIGVRQLITRIRKNESGIELP
jgi:predicted PurR-regulated permease PerM